MIALALSQVLNSEFVYNDTTRDSILLIEVETYVLGPVNKSSLKSHSRSYIHTALALDLTCSEACVLNLLELGILKRNVIYCGINIKIAICNGSVR